MTSPAADGAVLYRREVNALLGTVVLAGPVLALTLFPVMWEALGAWVAVLGLALVAAPIAWLGWRVLRLGVRLGPGGVEVRGVVRDRSWPLEQVLRFEPEAVLVTIYGDRVELHDTVRTDAVAQMTAHLEALRRGVAPGSS